MADESADLTESEEWTRLGVDLREEIHGGHQSRVFRADLDGQAIVVKLSDRRLVDSAFVRRVELVAQLAHINPAVVGPIPFDSGLVVPMGQWLFAAYPEVVGAVPDVGIENDVRTMAGTLANLHDSLQMLEERDVPMVAALRHEPDREWRGPMQLLHGDFSSENIRFVDGESRVFDFDDRGCGTIEFEIGNTLYMALFDSAMAGDESRFDDFRDWFVGSYRIEASRSVDDAEIDLAISLRIEALRRWIDEPATAPIGIRTASLEWLQTLRSFVQSR